MKLEPQDKLTIRAEKPQPTQVNKKLVWVVGFFVCAIIAIVFVSALQKTDAPPSTTKMSNNFMVDANPSLNQLPSSYTDPNVDKYLPNQNQGIPDAVKAQLAALQASQAQLQAQLAALNNQPKIPPPPTIDPLTDQAMHSGLFFPGSSPKEDDQQAVQTSLTKSATTPGAAAPAPTPYQAQNMQSQKVDFLKNDDSDDDSIYNTHAMIQPASPYEIQAGTLIPAVLLTAVNTSLPGEVVARVRNDVFSTVTGQFLLIPQGSNLIGQYDTSVSYGQRRVLIVFKRVIRPDGSSILLSNAPGSDLFGQAGVEGQVNNHWGQVIGSAVLSTILSVGAGIASDNYTGGANGGNQFYPSAVQNGISAAGGSISQTGQSITNNAMNIAPTLIIPTGYEFNIIVNKDMIMSPYDRLSPQMPSTTGTYRYHGEVYK